MKKNWFYLFMLMAITMMPLTSCDKEDEPKPDVEQKHDPESDADQEPVTAYNAASYLQGSLVIVNKDNEIIRRVYGKALDESQPDVISVLVADYAAAEELFLGWVAPDKEATKVEGGYDYTLTDEANNAQGSVSFRAVEDEPGVIARMTVAPDSKLKMISEVNFINADLWPENASQKYEAGNVYYMEAPFLSWKETWNDYEFNKPEIASLPFYCIQGNTNGKQAILVWLSPDADDDQLHPKPHYYWRDALEYLPSEKEAKEVVDFYNNNKPFWIKMLNEMDSKGLDWSAQTWPNATGNCEFMINKTEFLWWDFLLYNEKIYCMDLDLDETGEIDWALVLTSTFYYRYMHIRLCDPYYE